MMIAVANPATRLNPRGHLKQQVTLVIEAGHEEMWFAIRDFRGPFTAADLALAVDGKEQTAHHYLARLANAGHVERMGVTTEKLDLFKATKIGAVPSVFNKRGEASDDFELRRALWTATRRIKHGVTAGRLLDMVGQYHPVTAGQVKAWIKRLVAADYLTEMHGMSRKGEVEYQLRSMRDTGPLPPRFCEATLLYDLNLAIRGDKENAFFGVGQAREVTL